MSSPEPPELTAHHLEDGWTVHVSVPVEEEIGYNGGHTSGSRGFFWDPDMSEDEIRAVIDRQRADDLAALGAVEGVRLRVSRHGVDVTVLDGSHALGGKIDDVLWPPVVTPLGLVIRWEGSQVRAEHDDGRPVEHGEAPMIYENTIQPPLCVALDGTVSQLPFELAVRPLGAGADGRLLLPNCHPLWWDGDDEPFTWIDHAGETEPLLIDGEPVTVSRICTAIGEPHTNGREDAEHGTFWEPIQGRVVGDQLTVRLQGDSDLPSRGGAPWSFLLVTVCFSLAGPWKVGVVERGAVDADEVPPPL